ncbi:hypothetical protein ACVFYP_15930 [Roseomonas sp. F4]
MVENLVRPYGTAGSRRLDIYHRVDGKDTICAYDIKTGAAGLSAAQAARIFVEAYVFGQQSGNILSPRVLVIELRRTP